jgi:hypothetical protein
MRRLALGVLVLAFTACHDGVLDDGGPRIRVETISAAELPDDLDPKRTYWLSEGTMDDPEGFLRHLAARGFRPSRAWQPLPEDIPCMTVVPGPRFTLELHEDDPRVLELGFARGTSGLTCALRYVRYTVLD